MSTLKSDTFLQGGKYKIVRFISAGGFGCTYEGVHVLLKKRVAIKEFFVKDFCNRDEATAAVTIGITSKAALVKKLKTKFIEEAQFVSTLRHQHVVNVYDVFEENGTAYYVMDYVDGPSLNDILKRDGAMSEKKAQKYILQVADALKYVHLQNRLHLDVKPGNIMIDAEDNAILIDFGTSKQYDEEAGENTSTLMGKTPGFAPLEQMGNDVVKFYPSTDIYSLGATFYKLLTGITPPSATLLASGEELKPLPSSISENVRNAVNKAMQTDQNKRPQSIDEFVKILTEDDDTINGDVVERDKGNKGGKGTGVDTGKKGNKKGSENKESVYLLFICLCSIVLFFIILGIKGLPITTEGENSASYSNGVLTVNGVTYKMVPVTGGTFTMGATSEMQDAEEDEKPIHRVTLSSYSIGQTEVTQALWKAVMGHNPSSFKGDNLPVDSVSQSDCQIFISILNSLTGKQFRLPTEAEWEFAARGGNKSNYTQYSGSNNLDAVAWYDGNSENKTHRVATKKPNELGIYDMSGNVDEWCSDWYGDYSSSSQTNPKGPNRGACCVCRGGSWQRSGSCRVSYRGYGFPGRKCNLDGFRLCITETAGTSSVDKVASYSNRVLAVNGVTYRMVSVSGGTFMMGPTSDMIDPWDAESPMHQVTLSSYSIGQTEVTQALWKAVMGYNPSSFKGDNFPVDSVSWNDCHTFISKLNSLTGKRFRLPTEAEWEFAALGGNSSNHTEYSGSNNIDAVAWYDGNSENMTHRVATKQPNELGIYDMSGNVYEWCSDWYGDYSSSSQTNPKGPSIPCGFYFTVFRGGSWDYDAGLCRSSARNYREPGLNRSYIGFRLCISE